MSYGDTAYAQNNFQRVETTSEKDVLIKHANELFADMQKLRMQERFVIFEELKRLYYADCQAYIKDIEIQHESLHQQSEQIKRFLELNQIKP